MSEEIIYTENSTFYMVNRPILWFASGSKVPAQKIQEYFTAKGIKSLLDHDYLTYLHKDN